MSLLSKFFGDDDHFKKLEDKKNEELRLLKQRLAAQRAREKSAIDERTAKQIAGMQSAHHEQMRGIKDRSDTEKLDQFNGIVSTKEAFVDRFYNSNAGMVQSFVQSGNGDMALRAIENSFDSVMAQSIQELNKPVWASVPDEVRQDAIQKLQDLVRQKSIALRAMVTGEK